MMHLRNRIRSLDYDELEEIRQLCVQKMTEIQDIAVDTQVVDKGCIVDKYMEDYAYPFESPIKVDGYCRDIKTGKLVHDPVEALQFVSPGPDSFSTPVGKKIVFIDLTQDSD
jgi:hypothetical protein